MTKAPPTTTRRSRRCLAASSSLAGRRREGRGAYLLADGSVEIGRYKAGADHGEGMTQLGVVASLAGAARRAVRVSSDTDPDSDGSDIEGRC